MSTVGDFTRSIFDIVDLYTDQDTFIEYISVNNITENVNRLRDHIVYLTEFINYGANHLYVIRLHDIETTTYIYAFTKHRNPMKKHDALIRQILSQSTDIVGGSIGFSESYRKFKAHQACLTIKEELLSRPR
jgi:hypothetical protein